MILATTIFLATLVFIVWRPRGLGIGGSASAGAAFALATGVVGVDNIPIVMAMLKVLGFAPDGWFCCCC